MNETQKAMENFQLNHKLTNLNLIYAIILVKKSASLTYSQLGTNTELYNRITDICNEILAGNHDDMFTVEALQGGAGTSTNMNCNEVIAKLVFDKFGIACNPIDDVNKGQSTNDCYPTALRISAIKQLRILSDECAKLQQALQEKENEFAHIKKVARTELMDAVPCTLGEEFGCYAQAIARDRWRLYKIEERLRQVNIGGTAIGKSDNAERKYRFIMIENLRDLTDIGLCVAEYPMDITQNNDVFVEVSGLIKALSVNISKIANDLRLMSCNALGEISLAKMQKGSSIMPAKINPVMAEMAIQCSIKVQANDYAITCCACHGEFELNPFMPLIADSLLESLELMTSCCRLFREKCVDTISANEDKCSEHLEKSYAYCTQFTTKLGYETVEKVINESADSMTAVKALKQMIEKEKSND